MGPAFTRGILFSLLSSLPLSLYIKLSISQVVQAADQQQMVVILNLFDLNQEGRLNGGDDTILSAVENIVQFLVQQGAENVIFDLADACSNGMRGQGEGEVEERARDRES